MILQLILPHLASAALGGLVYAAVVWRRGRRAHPAAVRDTDDAQMERQVRNLRELFERFKLTANGAGISVWEWDLARDQVRTDARMINPEIYGSIGELVDRRQFLNETLHPDDRSAFIEAMEKVFYSSCEQFSHKYRVLRPDGGTSYLLLHGRAFRNAEGKALRLFALNLDITEQSLVAAKLEAHQQEQSELLRHLQLANRTAGLGAWKYDVVADRFTPDNYIARALGVTSAPIDGARAFLLKTVHPEDRDLYVGDVDAAITAGASYASRYRMVVPGGAIRYMQAYAHVERDAGGQAVRMLGVTMDVTADTLRTQQLERQAEEERILKEQVKAQAAQVQTLADRFSVATQAAGLYTWEMDARTRQVTWVGNRVKAFGLDQLPEGEYIAALDALVDREDLETIAEEARAAYAQGRESYSTRFRLTRDGVTRHMLSFTHIVRDEDGAPLRLVGATSDITNEVQTTQLLQRQAAQERTLIDRLNMATEAAGITSWEIDVRTRQFLWVENPLKGLIEIVAPIGEGSVDRLIERTLPEDRKIFSQQLKLAISTKQDSFAYRYRVTDQHGKVLHVQNHIRILMGEDSAASRVLGVSWDVTREVEAAARLEAQSDRQRELLERLSLSTEAAGINSWEVNLDTRRFTVADESLEAIHRVGVTDTTEEFFAKLPAEDRAGFHGVVREAIKERRNRVSFRYRLPRPNGEWTHIQAHARVIFDENGRARRLLGVSWDVTKEILAAQQLREAERRLERASLSSMEGHWELDVVTMRTWFSQSYHALLGYADGDLPSGHDFFSHIAHPEDRAQVLAAFQEHLQTDAPYSSDCRLLTRSGEYRWYRQRGMAERDGDGKPMLMSGSIQDIHEQKLAEDALREAQARFERAINGTQDGLWELESNGAAWCSPRVAQLLGYSPEELTHKSFLTEYLHPDDAVMAASATQAHFQDGAPFDLEVRLRTKCGEYRWYRARANAERDASGSAPRLSGSLQDVTEARSAREALLRATEAAESANRAKSEFLANVSHEIRTPLNGVVGMTGLLLDTDLDRTQRDYAETVRASADSLLIVINDILDFSKIEAGKLDIESLELDLHGAVEDVGGMMAFQAAAKNLELVVHVHPDVPERVVGDPQRIRQCLLNLVGNAVKFTQRGEIVIEVRNLGMQDGRVLTQFEVRDTGIGVARDKLKTLFQPFVQADSSTTRHFGGTGLGLSIVRRLVELMNGEVAAASEPGAGSAFSFTLPFAPAVDAGAGAAVDLTRLGRRILVVDDNETNRRVLAGQLMRAGYEVSLAAGGIEAISLMRQALADDHPYEAVLADYAMRDMDGASLGERINADSSLSRSRIVMLTSMDRQGDVRRFASLGFAAYLTKPVRARELVECMDRVLSRESKEWHLQSQPIVTRGALTGNESSRRYHGRVLLVEDNAVNQKVAVRFLERLGCSVQVADNGAEGLKACSEATYDVVFMDLQMPVMDGLTATRRIRALEGEARRTPIIALTANAMSGQLERCLEAGMDGFLTKPLEIARLHETLEQYGLGAAPGVTDASATGVHAAPIHLARLNELTDGDPQFARELAETFVASGEQVLQEIRDGLNASDRAALSRAAHKLKGASANIHADALRDLSYSLETQAAHLDQPRLRELIVALESEFRRAAQFLEAQTSDLQEDRLTG